MSLNLIDKNIFEIENFYFQNCSTERIEKIILQYELFKLASKTPGDIAEFGVFKGISFLRFAIFKKIFCKNKTLFGFDTFDKFPKANNNQDHKQRSKFIKEAGPKSITVSSLKKLLKKKNCQNNVTLIKGNIFATLPKFINKNKKRKYSLINLDLDLYEPTKFVLENIFSKISKNGYLILDNYQSFFGETKAVDEFCKKKLIKIKKKKLLNKIIYFLEKK